MPEVLISVLMPMKNGEKYLNACIDSIISQTEVNWELIVVDDHSDDKSAEIILSYASSDERIQLIKNRGWGIPSALQSALSVAKGDLITRMDCDDKMQENKLQLLKEALISKGKSHVATSLVEYFSDEELGRGFKNYEVWLNDVLQSNRIYKDIYKECTIPSSSWMLYKKDIEDHSLFENLEVPEDYDLCFKLYEKAFEPIVVNQKIHLWRDHSLRLTRNSEVYDIRKFGLFKLGKFLKIDHSELRDVVLWGAGEKGKAIAEILYKRNIDFLWISDNERKIGHFIHGTEVKERKEISNCRQPNVIVSVSNKEDQKEIKDYLDGLSSKFDLNYFFFF